MSNSAELWLSICSTCMYAHRHAELKYTTLICRIISHLGSGQYGSVSEGMWRSGAAVKEVAVKSLTDSANIVKFLQEAAIMAQFRHPNVVTLYGVVSSGTPVSCDVIL